jgi:hypothetical protein
MDHSLIGFLDLLYCGKSYLNTTSRAANTNTARLVDDVCRFEADLTSSIFQIQPAGILGQNGIRAATFSPFSNLIWM